MVYGWADVTASAQLDVCVQRKRILRASFPVLVRVRVGAVPIPSATVSPGMISGADPVASPLLPQGYNGLSVI
jgi:hypothetical protein